MSKNQELIGAVLERARQVDGVKKLACAEAFALASQLQVKPIEIGRICNQQNIRICNCELGCFA
jgi:hypothetical protein